MVEPPFTSRIAFVGLLTLAACDGGEPMAPEETAPPPVFVDRAAELGVDFVHFNGMTGELLYPEMMGSGVALLDYDGDGDLDLYLVQGNRLGDGAPLVPPSGSGTLSDRLYRNDLPAGDAEWRFVDRSGSSGALADGYGMGVAVGDVDGDGAPDLYVTQLGPNALLRNRGEGSFADWTERSGTGDPGWGVPAVFFDFDGDGRQDLYVGNYLDYSLAGDRACHGPTGARDYCGPTTYPAARDRLYRNLGGGTFSDASAAQGIGRPGRTLGAIAGDFDSDGLPDLYVANDGEANFLWVNRGSHFEERALIAGAALDLEGRPQAGMGVAVADFDRDGDDDLLLTHLTGEPNTLYRNEGGGRFTDVSRASGLAAATLAATGFGVAWLDYDADGWPDLLTVNGAVKRLEAQARLGDSYPLRQAKQLFRNRGDGTFDETSAAAGPAIAVERVGRGAATGDLDGDGDLDVAVNNNSGPAELLIDATTGPARWVGAVVPVDAWVRVSGVEHALGARSRTDGSYASGRDPRIVLALGELSGPIDLEISIKPGVVRRLRSVATDRYLVIHR